MGTQDFVAEARKFVDTRRKELSDYISILGGMSSNRDKAFNLLKNKILEIILANCSSWNKKSSSQEFETYAETFAKESLDGVTSDEEILKQNLKVLSTLGSIFASNKNSPMYFVKKTADEVDLLAVDRIAILEEIKLQLQILNDLILSIDDEWYSSQYLENTESALGDIDNALINLVTAYDCLYKNNALNSEELVLARNRINSSIGYLSKVWSAASMFDIQAALNNIDSLAKDLVMYDTELSLYIDNLKVCQTSFEENFASGRKFLDYSRETTKYQYDQLKSVRDSMSEIVRRKNQNLAISKSKEWIAQLATIAASSENIITDYTSSMSDSSNENTIKLNTFTSNIKSTTRAIDTTIPSKVINLRNMITKKLSININSDSIIELIESITALIDSQLSNTQNISSDCTSYEPEIVESVDEFISFITNLGLDRAKSVVVSSNWKDFFNLSERNMSHSDILSDIVLGFVNQLTDEELKIKILAIHYKIQSQKRTNGILGLTYDGLKQQAIDMLNDTKVKQINSISAQLDVVEKQ